MSYEFNPPYVPKMAPHPLAALFVEMYGHFFVWAYDREALIAYIADREDSRWATDDKFRNRLLDNVAAFLAAMVDIYNRPKEGEEPPEKIVGRQLYDSHYAEDVGKHVVRMLMARVRYAEKFNVDKDLMAVSRGRVLDTMTGKLVPMLPEHYMDRRTLLAPDADCPTPFFDELLHRITLGDAELAAYHLRFGGYALTGHVTEETVQFWIGEQASNGKSTLANIFRAIWRKDAYYASLNFASLTESNSNSDEMQMRTMGRLCGARVALAMEGKRKVQLDQEVFNKLTSSDELLGKYLFENAFSFGPTHKLIVGSNYEPVLQIDGASKRRLCLVPFNARFLSKAEFSEAPGTFLKDPAFAAKLEKELPGIFHKFVLGCLEWRERGLDPPSAVRARTDAYWGKVDVIAGWELEHKAEPDVFTETKVLYETYKKFVDGQGKPIRIEDFGEDLRRRGYVHGQRTIESRRRYGYYGLKP
jgi:P4 family phage/plasmid primase-like protien